MGTGFKRELKLAMDDQEFQTRAADALQDLYDRLGRAAEEHDFEADFNAGALAIEFEDPPAKFVVSPNSPVKQIWVSAHIEKLKLDWDPGPRRLRGQRPDAGGADRRSGREAVGLADQPVVFRKPVFRHATMPGVYISYPFCAQKCTYCNFASGVFPREHGSTIPGCAARRNREIAMAVDARDDLSRRRHAQPDGSRSAAGPARHDSRRAARISGSRRPWKPRRARSRRIRRRRGAGAGINRVSLGVQSFVPRELARTGRKHTAEIVEKRSRPAARGGHRQHQRRPDRRTPVANAKQLE